MDIIVAIDYWGEYSILRKCYDPEVEENQGIDDFLSEQISELTTTNEDHYGKVFYANFSIVPSRFADGDFDLHIELKKEVFDTNKIKLGLDKKPCIKCQKEIEWNEYSTNWEYCSDCFNRILKEN